MAAATTGMTVPPAKCVPWESATEALLRTPVNCMATIWATSLRICLPRCAPGVMLNRPVVVELTSGDSRVQKYFTGAGTTESILIPEGERDWTVRFGLCRERTAALKSSYQCNPVDWYDERSVTLDPGTPGTTLSVPTPPKRDCRTHS